MNIKNANATFNTQRTAQKNGFISSIGGNENLAAISEGKRFEVLWYKNPSALPNIATGKKYPFTGKELYAVEVMQMHQKFPQAKNYILPTGEMYWILPVKIDIGIRRVDYVFMLRYDNNHPHPQDWGGSCKTIFLSPTVDEINQRARAKRGRSAPHILTLPGTADERYLCAISKEEQKNMMQTGNVQGAAAVAARAIRYAYMFEAGMEDLAVWNELCKG